MQNTHVYIIIVNYLNWQDCIECIASVRRSDYHDYSIFIIDNNSPNDSVKEIITWGRSKNLRFFNKQEWDKSTLDAAPQINLLCNDQNTGFAAANNIILKKIINEPGYVWLLNPDMVVEKDTLSNLVGCMTSQNVQTVAGALVKNYHTKKDIFFGGGKIDLKNSRSVPAKKKADGRKLDFVSGACLFTPISNFREHGLLPEEYFLYWEEADWCRNAKQNGVQLMVCETAIAYDKISTTIGRGYLAHYYYCRNGLLFVSRHMPGLISAALRSMHLRMIKRSVLFQFHIVKAIRKAVKDFKQNKFHAHQ